jgi:hypothetical protein
MAKIGLFLGAGFSKWAVNLPIASQLFDFKIQIIGTREQEKFQFAKRVKEEWDKLNPDAYAEQFVDYALNSSEKIRQVVLWYIGRRLVDPFMWVEYHGGRNRRHVLMIDENRKKQVPGFQYAKEFINRICGSFMMGYYPEISGIITTNYDMVVEYVLGTKGFNYGIEDEILAGRGPYPVSSFANPVTLKGKIPLAKLHGSISWDNNHRYTDGRRGITGNSLIIAPTPEKTPPKTLQGVWRLAEDILKKTEYLIVFGFAFNPYDEAVLELLKSSRDNMKSILIVDIKPNAYKAKHIWPHADEIRGCEPPPNGLSEINEWIISSYK